MRRSIYLLSQVLRFEKIFKTDNAVYDSVVLHFHVGSNWENFHGARINQEKIIQSDVVDQHHDLVTYEFILVTFWLLARGQLRVRKCNVAALDGYYHGFSFGWD